MRNSVRHLIGALVVALSMLVLAGCAQTRSLQHSTTAGGYAQTAAVTRQTLDLLLADGSITSASVAVMHEDKVVFSQGFGFRDKTLSLPVDESTRFISVQSAGFTTAAVLMRFKKAA
jgi:CubicO group peptidase (beta-lactamase class C family)